MKYSILFILVPVIFLNSFLNITLIYNYYFSCITIVIDNIRYTREMQPMIKNLPIVDFLPSQEYQSTTSNQYSHNNTKCELKILSNFPNTPYQQNITINELIERQWKSKRDMDYFNCYTFDFFKQPYPQDIPSLYDAVINYKVNNTIILMYTDKGYMNNLVSSYYSSKLYLYSNLIVVCGDIDCYHVHIHII